MKSLFTILFLALCTGITHVKPQTLITANNLEQVVPIIEISTDYMVSPHIKWSPNGKHLAFHGRENPTHQNNQLPVKIWNIDTNALEMQFDHNISSIEWSPDGLYFAYVKTTPNTQDNTVQDLFLIIRDTINWDILYEINLDNKWGIFSNLEWSPDGHYLAFNMVELLHIWKVNYNNDLNLSNYWIIQNELSQYQSISWSADSKYLSGYTTSTWDESTASYSMGIIDIEEKNIQFEINRASESEWAPQTNLLAISDFITVKLFDMGSKKYLWEFDFINGWPRHISWSPDESMIIIPSTAHIDDYSLRIFDANTGAELYSLVSHTISPSYAEWSPDGSKIASSDRNGNIIIWGVPN